MLHPVDFVKRKISVFIYAFCNKRKVDFQPRFPESFGKLFHLGVCLTTQPDPRHIHQHLHTIQCVNDFKVGKRIETNTAIQILPQNAFKIHFAFCVNKCFQDFTLVVGSDGCFFGLTLRKFVHCFLILGICFGVLNSCLLKSACACEVGNLRFPIGVRFQIFREELCNLNAVFCSRPLYVAHTTRCFFARFKQQISNREKIVFRKHSIGQCFLNGIKGSRKHSALCAKSRKVNRTAILRIAYPGRFFDRRFVVKSFPIVSNHFSNKEQTVKIPFCLVKFFLCHVVGVFCNGFRKGVFVFRSCLCIFFHAPFYVECIVKAGKRICRFCFIVNLNANFGQGAFRFCNRGHRHIPPIHFLKGLLQLFKLPCFRRTRRGKFQQILDFIEDALKQIAVFHGKASDEFFVGKEIIPHKVSQQFLFNRIRVVFVSVKFAIHLVDCFQSRFVFAFGFCKFKSNLLQGFKLFGVTFEYVNKFVSHNSIQNLGRFDVDSNSVFCHNAIDDNVFGFFFDKFFDCFFACKVNLNTLFRFNFGNKVNKFVNLSCVVQNAAFHCTSVRVSALGINFRKSFFGDVEGHCLPCLLVVGFREAGVGNKVVDLFGQLCLKFSLFRFRSIGFQPLLQVFSFIHLGKLRTVFCFFFVQFVKCRFGFPAQCVLDLFDRDFASVHPLNDFVTEFCFLLFGEFFAAFFLFLYFCRKDFVYNGRFGFCKGSERLFCRFCGIVVCICFPRIINSTLKTAQNTADSTAHCGFLCHCFKVKNLFFAPVHFAEGSAYGSLKDFFCGLVYKCSTDNLEKVVSLCGILHNALNTAISGKPRFNCGVDSARKQCLYACGQVACTRTFCFVPRAARFLRKRSSPHRVGDKVLRRHQGFCACACVVQCGRRGKGCGRCRTGDVLLQICLCGVR